VVKHHPLQTNGGIQNVRIINEPDLFRLVVNSQLPAAEQFEKWVFEEVLPTIRKTGRYQTNATKPLSPSKQITEAAKVFKANYSIMRLIGCDQNGAAISANQATHKTLGVNLLELNERTHLVAENQDSGYYTPTELGKQIGLSAIKVNRLLAAEGLQERFADEWEATATGKAHSRWVDTMRRHSNGTPVTQLRWATSVLPLIHTPDQRAA